ncbi:MAG: T9SS type A sorting domain-containing protein [Prolixibacteraceae bacterium]|jgi:hypothetical protein
MTGENQQDVTIKFASKIISAQEVSGIEENIGIQIYSIQGVLLFNEEVSGPKTVKINMLNEGCYIARLLTAKGILSQMLIIQ